MHVTLVRVQVKLEHVSDFIAAARLDHEASVREPGNGDSISCSRPTIQPTLSSMYEAYASAADAAAHKQTAHYLAWRDGVAGWMVAPRQRVGSSGLFPQG